MVARFQLPADAASLQSIMEPCFMAIEDHERRARALDLVSCPALPGKALRKADVLVGSPGKSLPWAEDSESPNWTLPKITKTHPIVPKLALACYYGPAGYVKDSKEVLYRRLIPVPPDAIYCSYTPDATENRSHAECSHQIVDPY